MVYAENLFKKYCAHSTGATLQHVANILLLLLIASLFFTQIALAKYTFSPTEAEKDFIENTKPIEVTYDAFWPPFEAYSHEHQTIDGINHDILMLISELTGLQFTFKHGLTYADALEKLSLNKSTMHLSYDTNPEMAQELNGVLSDCFLATPIAMIGRGYHINEESIFAVSKLHPVTISFVKETFPHNTLLEFDDIEAAYEAVENGTADYTFENVYAARDAISDGKYPLLHISNVLPLYDRFSFIFSKNVDPRLISIINKGIAAFPRDKFSNILLKHTTLPSYTSQFVQFLSYISVDLLFGVIILLISLMIVLSIYGKRQRKMKNILQRKQKQIQEMLDAFPMPIYISDIDTFEILYCNKAVYKFYNCKDVISKYCYKVFRNLDEPCEKCSNSIIKKISHPYIWNRYDEDLNKHIQFADSCISWDDKENARLSIITDITEVLELQKEKLDEEINSIISENIPLCITFWNEAGDVIDCNQEILRTFKFETKQDYLNNFHKVMPTHQPNGRNSLELVKENHAYVLEHGYYRFEWLHKDCYDELIPSEVILVRSILDKKTIVISYVKDLREIKKSQELLKKAELRHTLLLDSMPMGIHFWNTNGELEYANQEAVNLFGFSSIEDCLQNFAKILPKYQPDGKLSLDLVKQQNENAYKHGFTKSETLCIHLITGEEIPVDVFVVRISYEGTDGLITYFRDVREQKAMLQELANNAEKLREAKEIAEQSTKAKGEFLANMSHEIRTPMNGILGLLHLLSQTEMTTTQEKYVQKTIFSANNLMRIINDILDFSKIEAGKLEMEERPFTLQSLCREVKDLYEPKCHEKQLLFQIDAGEHAETHLLGDALRLKQVLFNLVSNAIKFTEKGSITLHVESSIHEEHELHCCFTLRDTGIGLTPEQIKRLFSAFSQADNTVTRKYGGTGLGLIISQNIISLMRGKIWVESTYGQGSTFFCTAKFVLAPQNFQHGTQQEISPCQEIAHPLGAQHLLLAEDNEINQIVAQEILQAAGFTVDIAQNGQEALDMLEKNTYDAILMDIQMPIMDGYTAAKKIRLQNKYATLPIIAMSAHAMKGDKEISLSHGMNDHITKPIDPETLYKTLYYWIKANTKE